MHKRSFFFCMWFSSSSLPRRKRMCHIQENLSADESGMRTIRHSVDSVELLACIPIRIHSSCIVWYGDGELLESWRRESKEQKVEGPFPPCFILNLLFPVVHHSQVDSIWIRILMTKWIEMTRLWYRTSFYSLFVHFVIQDQKSFSRE